MESGLVLARMPIGKKEAVMEVLYQNKKAEEVHIVTENVETFLGGVYVGHIEKVNDTAGGCFVRFAEGKKGFLPSREFEKAIFKTDRERSGFCNEDELLVRVDKEQSRGKLAVLSCDIKLAGNFLIVDTAFTGLRFSAQFSKENKKAFLQQCSPEGSEFGFIVRSEAENADAEEIKKEAELLVSQLRQLIKKGKASPWGTTLKAPATPDIEMIIRSGRMRLDRILTDDPCIYRRLLSFAEENAAVFPWLKDKIKWYDDEFSLYKLFDLSTLLDRITTRKLLLRSGAEIVIDPVEACTVIDVNSAKAYRKHEADRELRINIEAAETIASVLKQRHISGMILIDFIDMPNQEQKDELLKLMRRLFKNDFAHPDAIDITALGIMEVTRKKVYKTIREQIDLHLNKTNESS